MQSTTLFAEEKRVVSLYFAKFSVSLHMKNLILVQSMKLLPTLLLAASSLTASAQVSFGNPYKFNDDWQFSLGDDSLAFQKQQNVRRLTLPHDWSIEGTASTSLASCQGYLPGGIGWYRKTFTISDTYPLHYIYFEGVYCRSTVYLNGHRLGHRPNGFASFMYDLTPYLKDGQNELLVKVDHSQQADSRWYTGSGIYRDVWMVAAGETHFSQWGLGWRATSITKSSATVEVEFSTNQDGTITLKEGDKLIAVAQASGSDNIYVVTREGKSIAFSEDDVRPMGRNAGGVRAILLEGQDEVVSMELDSEQQRKMLVITENGFGKRTPLEEYRLQARGGKGVATYDKTKFDKTGRLVGATLVNDEDEVMVINSNGVIIRIRAEEVSKSGRTTQGVKIMKVEKGNKIVSFAKVVDEENAVKPGKSSEEKRKENPNIGADGNEQMTLV